MSTDRAPQVFEVGKTTHTVVIRKVPQHLERIAVITSKGPKRTMLWEMPVELLGITASKDKWMREILVPCNECGEEVHARELNNGVCEDCFELA